MIRYLSSKFRSRDISWHSRFGATANGGRQLRAPRKLRTAVELVLRGPSVAERAIAAAAPPTPAVRPAATKHRHHRNLHWLVCAVFCLSVGSVLHHDRPGRVGAQGLPTDFTIAYLNDPHVNSTSVVDPTNDTNTKAFRAAIAWILAHQVSNNIVAVELDGDLGNQPGPNSGCAGRPPGDNFSDYQDIATRFQSLRDAGMAVLITPGNHDQELLQDCGSLRWNDYIAPFVAANFTSGFRMNSDILYGTSTTLANTQQYQRLDAVTASGTVKLGLGTLRMYADATDVGKLRALMDPDTDRQFAIGTHMFVGFTGDVCDHTITPTPEDECHEADGTSGRDDPKTMWANLRGNDRIIFAHSGHTHNDTKAGINLTSMTTISGNPAYAVSSTNTSNWGGYSTSTGLGRSNVTLVKFLPATHQFTVSMWITDCECNRTDWNSGAPKAYAWTPLLAAPATGMWPMPTAMKQLP